MGVSPMSVGARRRSRAGRPCYDTRSPLPRRKPECASSLRAVFLIALSLLAFALPTRAVGLALKSAASAPGDFPLVANGQAAAIVVDEADAEVVRIAADLLATDVERVSGVKPTVRPSGSQSRLQPSPAVVIIGTLSKSGPIIDLVKSGRLDAKTIDGKWESFVIAAVADPFPGVASALVIAGSDRRGTAYGVFEVSKTIGVSPWAWWADVPPQHRESLVIEAGTHVQGPPAVKYRGIFINDEDWGLQPWAAKTFEPEVGDIGPKTYAKIFELLLRLKANYCWPAMHPSTKAFNHYPENKIVADRYAIVMGSSHAEPMLRNNVDEWPRGQGHLWNPVTNLPAILDYWEQRVRENGRFENVYTVGMRGIHDSSMPGGGIIEEKRDRLQKIIGLQREMLARHVNPNPADVPQIFCPYKEVLEIYQTGMELPDDITIVWPDDNHGYIRQLPDARERQRSGGHGIYYHISYWGRPHDYLWLDSTSPALIWSEMTKAYKFGVDRVWVVNVGDIKSIETGMTFFLDLAWDVERYGPDAQRTFLREFYAQQFGPTHAEEMAALRDEYYRICAIRRPEHMGFNRIYPNTPVQNSDWSHAPDNDEAGAFLERWRAIARGAEALASKLPTEQREAYFQLVEYPACAGAAMAEKMILAEKARLSRSSDFARQAEAAVQRVEQLTARYNGLGEGKWQAIMDHAPRRLPVFGPPVTTPQEGTGSASSPPPRAPATIIDPTKFSRAQSREGRGWKVVEGLGPRGAALVVLPQQDVPTLNEPAAIRERAPFAEYRISHDQAGEVEIILEVLPTHRLTPAHEVLAAIAINDGEPLLVRFDQGKNDEYDPTWQTNVLRSMMPGQVTVRVPAGPSTLKVFAADSGVIIHGIKLVHGSASPAH
jgi:hypothetical protein